MGGLDLASPNFSLDMRHKLVILIRSKTVRIYARAPFKFNTVVLFLFTQYPHLDFC